MSIAQSKYLCRKRLCWRQYLYIVLFFSASSIFAKDTIIWRVTDWPPFYILHGKHQGEGLYDQVITLLEQNMPEYTHQRLEMNTLRVHREWQKGTHVCHPSVIPTGLTYNSVVNSFLLPHQLITHKSQHPLFQKPVVSLTEVLKDYALKGGITPERYTGEINQLVQPFLVHENIIQNPIYTSLINMFINKRIDYLIEYEPVVTYAYKVKGIENPTISLPISETNQNKYLKVVVGCNKNQWGKKVISKINRILIRESQNPGYLASRLAWYQGHNKQLLSTIYTNYYLNDKQQLAKTANKAL